MFFCFFVGHRKGPEGSSKSPARCGSWRLTNSRPCCPRGVTPSGFLLMIWRIISRHFQNSTRIHQPSFSQRIFRKQKQMEQLDTWKWWATVTICNPKKIEVGRIVLKRCGDTLKIIACTHFSRVFWGFSQWPPRRNSEWSHVWGIATRRRGEFTYPRYPPMKQGCFFWANIDEGVEFGHDTSRIGKWGVVTSRSILAVLLRL